MFLPNEGAGFGRGARHDGGAVHEQGQLVGVLTRGPKETHCPTPSSRDAARGETAVVYPNQPLRAVVHRMAETGLTRLSIVEQTTGGLVFLNDLLKPRARDLEEERRRERALKLGFLLPGAV
jgi:CIC family chloride channel protein